MEQHLQKVSSSARVFAWLTLAVPGIFYIGLPSVHADLGKVNMIMTATLVASTCSVSTDSTDRYVELGSWGTGQRIISAPEKTEPLLFSSY